MSETPEKHMGKRGYRKDYSWPGTYHITISVMERKHQPLGRITGDASKPDGHPLAPKVLLSEIGKMVEKELLCSIRAHYPMVEVQDYVIMPDHLHFIVQVHRDIISSNGRKTHLGQVIAGFKKGCNRRYWELTGQPAPDWQGKPFPASTPLPASPLLPASTPLPASPPLPAVHPQGFKLPSSATTGRPPLFAYGYVDVMPLKEGQLERQREYIRNNPRYRLLRQSNPQWLMPKRVSIRTALSLPALKGYLQRECAPSQFSPDTWERISQRLLSDNNLPQFGIRIKIT